MYKMLKKIVNCAVPAGTDSTGAEMVKIRRALLDQAREVLAGYTDPPAFEGERDLRDKEYRNSDDPHPLDNCDHTLSPAGWCLKCGHVPAKG